MVNAIEITGLVKSFGGSRPSTGWTSTVRAGEVHGFLGPNGAGKSTTIRVLLGLLRADAGAVRLLGGDPWRDAVALHRRLAYVPGEVNLWPNLTGGEVIDLLGRLRGGLDPRRRDELLERFELDPTKKGRTYSKGNRQKVALVAALASDVELLLLDEPTSGLDPLMEAVFQEMHRTRSRAPAGRCCCPATSWPRWRRSATGSRIIRAGRIVETRHARRAAPPDPHVGRSPSSRTGRPGSADLPGVHDLRVGRRLGDVRRGHRSTWTRRSARCTRTACAWSASRRRWSSSSCATTGWRHDRHQHRSPGPAPAPSSGSRFAATGSASPRGSAVSRSTPS